jgi:hypothetical protein
VACFKSAPNWCTARQNPSLSEPLRTDDEGIQSPCLTQRGSHHGLPFRQRRPRPKGTTIVVAPLAAPGCVYRAVVRERQNLVTPRGFIAARPAGAAWYASLYTSGLLQTAPVVWAHTIAPAKSRCLDPRPAIVGNPTMVNKAGTVDCRSATELATPWNLGCFPAFRIVELIIEVPANGAWSLRSSWRVGKNTPECLPDMRSDTRGLTVPLRFGSSR